MKGATAITTTEPSIVEIADRLIEERSHLKHPLYQAWQRDELAMNALWGFLDGVYEAPVAAGAVG